MIEEYSWRICNQTNSTTLLSFYYVLFGLDVIKVLFG